MFICISNWYAALDKNKYFKNSGDHADEMETSMLLYLRPDLVLPVEKWGEGKWKKNKIKEFAEGWLWTERKWSKITEDTGIGSPKLATTQKGEAYFNELTVKIGNLIYDLCELDIDKMYE
jgi:creatinine amidohydrolase